MKCQARQHSDQMICHQCSLVWDTNDPDPPRCKNAAERARDAVKAMGLDVKEPRQQIEARERGAFEAWWRSIGSTFELTRDPNWPRGYAISQVQCAWTAWLAALELNKELLTRTSHRTPR